MKGRISKVRQTIRTADDLEYETEREITEKMAKMADYSGIKEKVERDIHEIQKCIEEVKAMIKQSQRQQ